MQCQIGGKQRWHHDWSTQKLSGVSLALVNEKEPIGVVDECRPTPQATLTTRG